MILDDFRPEPRFWVGRSPQLTKLETWLTDDTVRLVGITAAGGYGKSALAARLYDRVQEQPDKPFDRYLWLYFSQSYAFADWGRALLVQLGKSVAPDSSPGSSAEQVEIALVRELTASRCLLVLDNLEVLLSETHQWIDPGYERFLVRWLQGRGRGKLLMTSRERLPLPSNALPLCRWLPLPGLEAADGIKLLTDLTIRGSAADLQEFVTLADGHPLLLTLAAGLLLSEEGDEPDIAALKRPDLNLFAIVGMHRQNPADSVAALLEASLSRLSERLQTLLRSLCVFPMSFSCKLLGVLNAYRDLEIGEAELRQIARRSLLQESRQGGEWTFQFPPLIQRYLQQTTLSFYRQGGDQWGEANTLQAIGDVLQFLDRRSEALENYEQAIAIYRQVGARLGEANTLQAIGDVLQFLKRSSEALENYEQAIGIYRQVGARLGEANTLRAIGDVLQFLDRRSEALENYEQAIAIYRQVGARLGEANTLKAIGDVLQFLDRRSEALENYEQAIGIYRQVGARLGEANTLKAIGDVLQFLKRSSEALENYEQAIAIYRQVGARLGEANTLQAIGDVLQFLDRRSEALENYEQAIGIYRQVGDRLGEANTLRAIGDVLQFLDRRSEALENYEQAIAIYRQVGARLGEANTLKAIGDVLQFLDRRSEALENYDQAIGIYRQVGARLGEANTLAGLGNLHFAQGEYEQALPFQQQRLAMMREIGDRYSEAAAQYYIGRTLAQLDQTPAAIQAYASARDIFADIQLENLVQLCQEAIDALSQ